jgi:hypothetical protein
MGTGTTNFLDLLFPFALSFTITAMAPQLLKMKTKMGPLHTSEVAQLDEGRFPAL